MIFGRKSIEDVQFLPPWITISDLDYLLSFRKWDGEGNGTPLQYSCLEKSHEWRSLEGCSPWGRWGSDMTERLRFHFSLSCIVEGNGNPLQCSCLENPRDGASWWAAVYAVSESRTWLKWLSSSRKWEKKYLLYLTTVCCCYSLLNLIPTYTLNQSQIFLYSSCVH